jgi:hypothetical protein
LTRYSYRERVSANAWRGPPKDILGCAVPVQQFVARTDHLVVALQQVVAFPEGCVLSLHVAVQRGSLDESTWNGLVTSHSRRYPEFPQPGDDLKFGVRFPDGSRDTTVGHAFRGWAHPTDRPEPPMLVEAGSQSSGGDLYYQRHWRLWLWPLPPLGSFEFVIEWHSMGIDMTSVKLDGSAIVRAAERALPYWP